jgi:hypothetical protein
VALVVRSSSRHRWSLPRRSRIDRPKDASPAQVAGRRYAANVNTILRVLLALWTLLFLAIACAPLYSGNGVVGILGFLTGALLLVPWLIGVFVIGGLIWLTNGPRR